MPGATVRTVTLTLLVTALLIAQTLPARPPAQADPSPRRARAQGVPRSLIAHEDLLVFRVGPKR